MTRLGFLVATSVAVLGIAVVSATPMPLKLIWNATASAPVGFYTVSPTGRIEVPDLVAVMPPEPFASFMVERGYVGRDVPILKHVVGLPGQRVCRDGRAITVDDVPLGEARDRDSRGRDLPAWQGCRVIADGELFLMNLEAVDSLDGRYFGPFPAAGVIGGATPLFTDEEGDGRFVWRAPPRCARPVRPPPAAQETTTMAQIGQFTRTETGFEREFRTLGIREEMTLVPVEPSDTENAPK